MYRIMTRWVRPELYRKTGKTWEPQREYAQANAA